MKRKAQEGLGSAELRPYDATLGMRSAWKWIGRVVAVTGQTVVSEGPLCSVGESCLLVDEMGVHHSGEIIGFRGTNVVSMPLNAIHGIQYGDGVRALGSVPSLPVSEHMLGRILNGLGEPMDGLPPLRVRAMWPLDSDAPATIEREPIREPKRMRFHMTDGMPMVARGQRVGIFGGAGVDTSTLIEMTARNIAADLTVVGLVGKGRSDVREFVEYSLGDHGLRRAVVVVSTSDESPLLRMRAAMAATAVAEFHAARGKHVFLVLDSLTRYALAAREVGLAAGETPASSGYLPSVLARLTRLVDRAGNFENGSITAFYLVLMEGDSQEDSVVDLAPPLLDGHIVLSGVESLSAYGRLAKDVGSDGV